MHSPQVLRQIAFTTFSGIVIGMTFVGRVVPAGISKLTSWQTLKASNRQLKYFSQIGETFAYAICATKILSPLASDIKMRMARIADKVSSIWEEICLKRISKESWNSHSRRQIIFARRFCLRWVLTTTRLVRSWSRRWWILASTRLIRSWSRRCSRVSLDRVQAFYSLPDDILKFHNKLLEKLY